MIYEFVGMITKQLGQRTLKCEKCGDLKSYLSIMQNADTKKLIKVCRKCEETIEYENLEETI